MIRNKLHQGGQPAQMVVETVKGKVKPLQLDIQFFADGGTDPNNQTNPPGGDPAGTNPAGTDPNADDPLDEFTLKDLLKNNPKIKAEYNERVESVVKRRLKNLPGKPNDTNPNNSGTDPLDTDPPAPVDNVELTAAKQRALKLENRTKQLGVAAFVAGQDGYTADHVKLIERLSANRIHELDLDDDGMLDAEEVSDLVESIVDEFPTLFTATSGSGTDPVAAPVKRKTFNPGPANQQTNDPKKDTSKGVDAMKERHERLKKSGRI